MTTMDYDAFAIGPEWDKQAAALFAGSRLTTIDQVRAYTADGTCPRCQHRVIANGTLDIAYSRMPGTRSGRVASKASTPSAPVAVAVGCGCDHRHPGAPQGVLGCGAEFAITINPD